jgi:DNA-binding response OmpR family regulator
MHLETDDISIDLDGHTVHLKPDAVENTELQELLFTRIEFKLLVYLLQNRNTVLPRELLLQKIWGSNTNVTDRVVDIHISHLRKKLQQTKLKFESLRGEGYKLVV